jgi:hypothetical protein
LRHLDTITQIRDLNDDILQAHLLMRKGKVSETAATDYITRHEAMIETLEATLTPAAT